MKRRAFLTVVGLGVMSTSCGKLNVLTEPTIESPDRLSSPLAIGTARYHVRNECWYALRREWLTKGDDALGPGGHGTLSNWNWLSKSADANANGLRYALRTYGGFVSDLIPGYGGDLTSAEENYWADRLSGDSYALRYDGVNAGHGCQCVSFAGMAIYRATGGNYRLAWSWASMNPAAYPPATNATPGDLVWYNQSSARRHVGICVRNYGSGVTVVDSNFLGHEVIGRHNVSNTAIGTKWKVFSGRGRWY